MKEILTREDFLESLKHAGYIMITDLPTNGVRYHKTSCSHVSLPHFEKKVIENLKVNGQYFLIGQNEIALVEKEWRAVPCAVCMRGDDR